MMRLPHQVEKPDPVALARELEESRQNLEQRTSDLRRQKPSSVFENATNKQSINRVASLSQQLSTLQKDHTDFE